MLINYERFDFSFFHSSPTQKKKERTDRRQRVWTIDFRQPRGMTTSANAFFSFLQEQSRRTDTEPNRHHYRREPTPSPIQTLFGLSLFTRDRNRHEQKAFISCFQQRCWGRTTNYSGESMPSDFEVFGKKVHLYFYLSFTKINQSLGKLLIKQN